MQKRKTSLQRRQRWADLKAELKIRLERLSHQLVYLLLTPYRIFKIICFSLGFTVLILLLAVSIYFYGIYTSLPDFKRTPFAKLQQSAEKSVRAKLSSRKMKGKWTRLNDISRDLLYAVVMSEDATFFEHSGVNYDAMVNAALKNLQKQRYAFGASTISQQVVKNVFLVNQKTLSRKLKEVIITHSLENHFNKNQILELYLNIAEFGPDIYGVDAAAREFFAKSPSQINAAEGAFLAIMLPAPRRLHYSVYVNRNLTSSKRRKIRRILRDMLYNEFISQEQYQRYINYDFFRRRSPSSSRN